MEDRPPLAADSPQGVTMARALTATTVVTAPSPDALEAVRPDLRRTYLAHLSHSDDIAVRAAIASRTDMPLPVQEALARDPSKQVRAAIAANPQCARAVLDALAVDRQAVVLSALVGNPVLHDEVLTRLALHRSVEIRQIAAQQLADRGAPRLVNRGTETPADRGESMTGEHWRVRDFAITDLLNSRPAAVTPVSPEPHVRLALVGAFARTTAVKGFRVSKPL